MSETRLAVEVRSRSRHSTKALRITLISRFSARAPPIRQRHYGHALLAWQCQNESNGAVSTLNSLALPFRTQRAIEVWRSGSGGRSSYGNAGVWPHRHEAFGPRLSVLGFGCGAVGGLMVRGDWRDQERTVARAIGTTSTLRCSMAMENRRKISALSRKSSNRPTWWWALRSGCGAKTSGTFRHRDKVARRQFGAIALERVDVFHLHIGAAEKRSASGRCSTRWCHTRASTRARQYGFLGLTAIGDTGALRQVIEAGVFDGAQVVYNMLNPSAATELPPNYPAQDYWRLFDHTKTAGELFRCTMSIILTATPFA